MYAVCDSETLGPPQDGKPLSIRAYDPEVEPHDLTDAEVLIDELPEGVSLGDLVWSDGEVRQMSEAEREAHKPALYGMEGLYAEVSKRKAAGEPDPITTDELLGMMERVQKGEVQG